MTDQDLLALGCVVSFIAACGAYAFVRERFLRSDRLRERPPVPVALRAERRRRRHVA